jgi:murein DD-endopeptidase MepM/ murein hydrolase activator NlpD
MEELQAELDAAAARIDALHSRQETVTDRLDGLKEDIEDVDKRNAKLREEVAERASALYKSGGTGMFEALLESNDFAELNDRAQMLSQVSADDNSAFIKLSRSEDQLKLLNESLRDEQANFDEVNAALVADAAELQGKFNLAAAQYEVAESGAAVGAVPISFKQSGGMFCPVAGPTSFVDSWGAPRSGGRSHQGVDMMGAYGTPQVAIVSGTITYAAYSSIGGNVQYLEGDDGNLYVYIHQASHIVTSGRVRAGQQISVLGDSGNAAGNPHLHFEFHPGGGAAVNPTPLVSSLC